MKIVNLKKFLELPAGTLYSPFDRETFFGDILIKGSNAGVGHSFYAQGLLELQVNNSDEHLELMTRAPDTGESFGLDLDCMGHEHAMGDHWFMVFEQQDHRKVIQRLVQAYIDTGGEPFNLSVTAPAVDVEEHVHVGNIEVGRHGDTEHSKVIEDVIRTDENGHERNYGKLVAWNIDGKPFLIREDYAFKLGFKGVIMKTIPKFVQNFRIELALGTVSMEVWALEKEDIADLAIALSKRFAHYTVGVGQSGRWLQAWVGGEDQFPRRTLDYYYYNLTKEQVEASKF
jgi:hypothetical protein